MSQVKFGDVPTPKLVATPWGIKRPQSFQNLWSHLVKNSLNPTCSTELILSAGLLSQLKLSRRTAMRFIKYLIQAKLIAKASRQLGSGRGVLYRNIWVENHLRWCARKTQVLKKKINTINDTCVSNENFHQSGFHRKATATSLSEKTHAASNRKVFNKPPQDLELEEIWENLRARVAAGLRAPAMRRACQLVRLSAWREGLSINEQHQFTNFIGSKIKHLETEEIPELVEGVLDFISRRWGEVKAKLWRVRRQAGLPAAKREFYALLTRWLIRSGVLEQRTQPSGGRLTMPASWRVLSADAAPDAQILYEDGAWNLQSSSENYLSQLPPNEVENFWREVYEGAERERALLAQKSLNVMKITFNGAV